MNIQAKNIYRWLTIHHPQSVGIEAIYDDKHEVVGLSNYDNMILEHVVNPIPIAEENIEAYVLSRYYIPKHMKDKQKYIKQIINKYYYKYDDIWYYDDAPLTGPFLKGNIKVLNIFYSDRDMLKRYFELEERDY